MTTWCLKSLGVAALLTLAGSNAPAPQLALAQDGAPPDSVRDPDERVREARERAEAQEPAELNFEGGTVSEYVRLLRERLPKANIAVDSNADGVRVSPVQLRYLQAASACYALETLTMLDSGEPGVMVSDYNGMYTIRANPRLSPARASIQALSLAEILAMGVKDQDALSVIESGVMMADPDATLRFHAETGVLLLAGNDGAREAASNVLKGLERHAMVLERQSEEAKKAQSLRDEAETLRKKVESDELLLTSMRSELQATQRTTSVEVERFRLQAQSAVEAQQEAQVRLQELHARFMSVTEEAERHKARAEAVMQENQALRAELDDLRKQAQKQGE